MINQHTNDVMIFDRVLNDFNQETGSNLSTPLAFFAYTDLYDSDVSPALYSMIEYAVRLELQNMLRSQAGLEILAEFTSEKTKVDITAYTDRDGHYPVEKVVSELRDYLMDKLEVAWDKSRANVNCLDFGLCQHAIDSVIPDVNKRLAKDGIAPIDKLDYMEAEGSVKTVLLHAIIGQLGESLEGRNYDERRKAVLPLISSELKDAVILGFETNNHDDLLGTLIGAYAIDVLEDVITKDFRNATKEELDILLGGK